MKILEICPYSAGGCGVWARARSESELFVKKGYDVTVFSSNFEKGTDKIMPAEEVLNGIKIKRFPAMQPGKKPLKFLPGGESFMFMNFIEEAVNLSPDIIFAHNYRQFHTDLALIVAKRLKRENKKCKIFLVTHAPFPEGDITRSFWGHSAAWFYDYFIGRFTVNKFYKILTISHWEEPFLLKIGAKKEKIVYIPNGIPGEFFTQKKSKEQNKVLFLGRISPKKKIETLISAIPYLKDKKVQIEIVGPAEEEYFSRIKKLVDELNVGNRIKFTGAIFDLKEKIKKIDSAKIYVLPSRVEGMPQALIEVMARGKIVIGSDSLAIRDLIQDKKNGYLFEFDKPEDLAKVIDLALKDKNSKKIKNSAKKDVKHFSWDKVILQIEKEIN